MTEDKNVKKVYLNVCSRRAPEWGMILKTQQAMQVASKNGITTSMAPRVGESLICRARQNSLVCFTEREEYDYLLSVDDDIELPTDAIVKLVQSEKDIIGGFYRLKQSDAANTAVRPLTENTFKLADVLKKGLMIEVKYVSTGCMLVKRAVVEDMIKRYPELEYDQNATGKVAYALYQPFIHTHRDGFREYLSEDWAFCQRARNLGYSIWADGSIRCGHWGLTNYDFEDVKE